MTLEEWRQEKGLSLTALAEMLGAGSATVVRRWCLPAEHKNSIVPSDRFMQVIQQTTLGAVTQHAWAARQSGVRSPKANKGGRNERQSKT